MFRRWFGSGVLAALVLAGGCSSNKTTPVTPPPTPPKAASDLYATSTSTSRISLRWRDNSTDETGFRIERREESSEHFLPVPPVDTVGPNITTFDDIRVINGVRYTYRVSAYRYAAAATPSNEVTVLAADKVPPAPPSNPSPPNGAPDIDENSAVTLGWTGTDPAGEPINFDVYFGRTLGTMKSKVSNTTATSYTVTDETLVRNAHYFWRVIVHDRTGVSVPSPVWGFNTPVDRDTVPDGYFIMGDTLQYVEGDSATVNPLWHPGNPVRTQKYSIDRYLVTNQQYADFLNQMLSAGKLWLNADRVYNLARENLWATISPGDSDSDLYFSVADSAFYVSEGREGFPVVQVSWYGAEEYATHHGRRLPSEAEWEKAARGTARDVLGGRVFESLPDTIGLGTPYPWGRWAGLQDLNRGNYRNSGDPYENAGRVRSTPPGFYNGTVNLGYQTANGASPYGVYDMSGNVWQWIEDWYGVYRKPHVPPTFGSFKVIRGGSYDKSYGSAICWNRSYVSPEMSDRAIGFRTVAVVR
jgi:formylglycine-generating enzyme required for sulfatase activity